MENPATHSKLWKVIDEAIDDYDHTACGLSLPAFIEQRILAGANKNRTKTKQGKTMTVEDLIPGKLYKMKAGDIAEFSRIGGTGGAIFHPVGEPDTQSSFIIKPEFVEREASYQEEKQLRRGTY